MDEYLTAIRTLAVDCNFGDTLDERLLEQLMNGCAEKRIQEELLILTPGRVSSLSDESSPSCDLTILRGRKAT